MGPINWVAVVLAANLAVAVGIVWYGPIFRGPRQLFDGHGPEGKRPARTYLWSVSAMLVIATMIGHNFARVGAETLAAKPWLYWMMSGGLGLAIIAPALFIGLARHDVPMRDRLIDCGHWIVALLAMGTVFWALG
ncbi:MAG TPA: DUF1761 domain-containing protein [Novosphingobium sp.]